MNEVQVSVPLIYTGSSQRSGRDSMTILFAKVKLKKKTELIKRLSPLTFPTVGMTKDIFEISQKEVVLRIHLVEFIEIYVWGSQILHFN